MSGTLALVGGAEWRQGCSFDTELLERAGGEVLVLPTAAAYERPERAVDWARQWFASLGGRMKALMVLSRSDAESEENARAVAEARFVYLGGGSPLHLRSVLKESAVWRALREAWQQGAVVAGSSAGAMVLSDPMVDPRGGAFTLDLGLVEQLAVVPHFPGWSDHRVARTVALAATGLTLAGIEERTALIRDPDGGWRSAGAGHVEVLVDGQPANLDALPGRTQLTRDQGEP
jgi:cyanophycinase